jgi:hypothetical protein
MTVRFTVGHSGLGLMSLNPRVEEVLELTHRACENWPLRFLMQWLGWAQYRNEKSSIWEM